MVTEHEQCCTDDVDPVLAEEILGALGLPLTMDDDIIIGDMLSPKAATSLVVPLTSHGGPSSSDSAGVPALDPLSSILVHPPEKPADIQTKMIWKYGLDHIKNT